MEAQYALRLCREALVLVLVLSGPALLASLVIGLIVSVFQAMTQVQEQTLSSVPKIVAVFAVLAITGPWLISQLVSFTVRLFSSIPRIGGG